MNKVNTLACGILLIMAALMFGSVWNESATMDELPHIPAGFGYITQFDYRLNPEHPPLIKIFAATFAEFIVQPYFPTNTSFWEKDVNGQWDQGRAFLYESGNDADAIIFWARVPIILLAILFGWLLFQWTRRRFGTASALLTLTFFAFSPTILAHSRYVTTDLGAAFGFFIGVASYLTFLENRRTRTLLAAGLAFGVAELLKFSLILLLPIYAIMLITWVATRAELHIRDRVALLARLFVHTVQIGFIGLAVIWAVYIPLIWNYPPERQYDDAEFTLTSYPIKPFAQFDLQLIKNPYTRPLGEYLLGFLMVSQRAGGGNTGYFLGTVSALGSRAYFPMLYLLKEPLAFHILTLIALLFAFSVVYKKNKFNVYPKKILEWTRNHFAEFSALIVIGVYWASSLLSPLNIGVRHVLPTFPFIYLLVSKTIIEWLGSHEFSNPKSWREVLSNFFQLYISRIPKLTIFIILLLWLIARTVAGFPYFLPYYNELAGGTQNGYTIAVDSNYDWGQDLKRLKDFTEKNNIEKIAIDYFGGGNPAYYFGDTFEPWWSARGPAHGWFAISATFQQGAFGTPAPGFIRNTEDSYPWLREYTPVARAGTSIFIYYLP